MNRFHLLCVIAKKNRAASPKAHSIAEVGCERNMAAECGCPESHRFCNTDAFHRLS
jgi:hypothetical protein